MRILTANELTKMGIAVAQVQQSLTLTYLTKEFRRQSDLPKKFKDKALNICQELYQNGKDSFVTETNYSYTVWEEEKTVNESTNTDNNSLTNSVIPEQKTVMKQDKSFSSSPYSLKNYISKKSN